MNKILYEDCHVFNDKYIPRRKFAKYFDVKPPLNVRQSDNRSYIFFFCLTLKNISRICRDKHKVNIIVQWFNETNSRYTE